MSLCAQPIPCIPAETIRVAKAAFPKVNLCLHLRDALGTIYQDSDFAALFPPCGQHAQAPWQLALVSVLQFAEGLSDRQAAEAVRGRIDWKYLLSLELADPGFDSSVLCEFRARLIAGSAEEQLLTTFLKVCCDHQLIKARARQRTDSTHVLAAVRTLNRLECVIETMRLTLNVLATVVPEWLRVHSQPTWVERYGARIEESRLPTSQPKRQELAQMVGQDGQELLAALFAGDAPVWLRALPAVETMRQVWLQQYFQREQKLYWRTEQDGLPPSTTFIATPYDTQAHYAKKRSTAWLGYKVHLSESYDDDSPHLITHVETTLAPLVDGEALPVIHESLQQKNLLPNIHLADTGYVRAQSLIESRENYGIDLCGPTLADYHWQSRAAQGFAASDFVLDFEQQSATCPQGQTTRCWTPSHDSHHNFVFKVQFAQALCQRCASKSRCTRASRRTLLVKPQPLHDALRKARDREGTESYQQQYRKRAGIEGTISQGVRAFGLRRTRYVGLAKTRLQHVLTAIAINWSRLSDWWQGKASAQTQQSAFARLYLQLRAT